MKTTEGYFISHCEDGECDLGRFHYTCPNCNNHCDDYEIWWYDLEIYMGEIFKFKCDDCKCNLTVKYDKKENLYKVKTDVI